MQHAIALLTPAEQIAQIEAIAADPNAYVAETRRLARQGHWCSACQVRHHRGLHSRSCPWPASIWRRAQQEGR